MRRPLLLLACVCSMGATTAQGLSHDLYDRRGASFAPKGWTLGIGAAGLRAEPAEWEQLWRTGPALDTALYGGWQADAPLQPAAFVARWWRFQQPVVFDRVAVEFQGSRRRYVEDFTSWLPDSTRYGGEGAAWLTSLGVHGYRAVAWTPDLYVEGMVGAGVDGLWGRSWAPAGPDSLMGVAPEDRTWRFAVEGGLAFGVRIWPGRFVRLALTADLLQFAPLAEERGAAMDLLRQGYRPWTLALKWDLQQVRPPLACATVNDDPYAPREQKGTQLFGPEMKPKKKKKPRRKKRRN